MITQLMLRRWGMYRKLFYVVFIALGLSVSAYAGSYNYNDYYSTYSNPDSSTYIEKYSVCKSTYKSLRNCVSQCLSQDTEHAAALYKDCRNSCDSEANHDPLIQLFELRHYCDHLRVTENKARNSKQKKE
jgi:hypothetical protein